LGDHREEIPFAKFSRKLNLSFQPPVLPNLLCEKIKKLLVDLGKDLKENGCTLIGHMKVFIESDGEGYFFSTTSFEQVPDCKGSITGEISDIALTINVIVYGLSEKELSILVNKKLLTFHPI
jgi:hypothetical protein